MRRPNARKPEPKPEPQPDLDPNMDRSLSIKSFQFRQNPNSRSNSFSKTLKNQSKSNLLSFSLLSISFSLLFYFLFVFFWAKPGPKYGLIIDGGSTGSRIHVFEYKVGNDGVPRFDFLSNGHSSLKVNPGLSAFGEGEGDVDRAGESLVELLEFGKRKVPKEVWGQTEVRLMATAGLRLVDLKVRDRILESCRRVLRSSGFKFRDDWAEVITGEIECIIFGDFCYVVV